jgi:hypothetical protein
VVDDDVDFEIVTSARQLGPPPALRRELVVLPEIRTTSGKATALYEYELSAKDFSAYQETSRVYVAGEFRSVTFKDEEIRFLAFTTRDENGNRLWHSTDAAIAQLGMYGRTSLQKLVAAANRVNSASVSSAEGNSGETPSDSSS